MTNTVAGQIGFLATGNEVVEGDILNTNGQNIARRLVETGLTIGMHVATSDREAELEAGLRFLLTHHDTVITIGGLGPTSDDRTRFVISKVLNQPLVFDEKSWQNIRERFARFNLKWTDDLENANRQQALFPEGATILANDNGSAAGCAMTYQDKKIFMLPGPPNECLPMFEKFVLPVLVKKVVNKTTKLQWLLLGAIEGEIASLVDAAVKNYPVITGYRIAQPYLEVKIYVTEAIDLDALNSVMEKIVSPYLVSTNKKTASELLSDAIEQFTTVISITDKATGGLLEATLLSPQTYSKLRFVSAADTAKLNNLHIDIEGLAEFWGGQKPAGVSNVVLKFHHLDTPEMVTIKVPFRNELFVRKFAVEYIARAILQFLKL